MSATRKRMLRWVRRADRTIRHATPVVVLPLLLQTAAADPQDEFPYAWTDETDLPAWQLQRVEESGPVGITTPIRSVRYLTKLFRKKFTAPPEVIEWFEVQKDVLRTAVSGTPATREQLAIAFAGDIMWLRDGWMGFLDPAVLAHLNDHDMMFADLETSIAASLPVPRGPSWRKTFNSPPELLGAFRRPDGSSTFSALSVAGNHALDNGDAGMLETLSFLGREGIAYSGVAVANGSSRWVLLEKNGFRVGFYAATYGVNGAAERDTELRFNLLPGIASFHGSGPPDLAELRQVLTEMRNSDVSIKIVSLRWGFEYEYYPTPPQMQLAREIVRAGADIIMGHHSHAQQPLEVCFVDGYEKRLSSASAGDHVDNHCRVQSDFDEPRKALVIYSLGNFVTTMAGFLNKVGMVQTVIFTRAANGRADWHSQSHRLLFNAPEDPSTNSRRTVFVDEWVERDCFRKRGCRRKDMEQLAFVRTLLGH